MKPKSNAKLNLKDPTMVILAYFLGEVVTDQKIIFEGTAKQLREQQFGEEWDGFHLGDGFKIEDKEVKVFEVKDEFDSNLEISKVRYLIGPRDLDPKKVNL
ncbi:hypothetical protein [Halalkalibacter alkalisediminis]|uniref:Uncharacterized protein n=1 Tax=Halalkalibacter alkalisediminis TaxID=935616 RepID=A0ABV6NID6_9BACI|nr:hypothetical protein [Halalkalibacter alkalisediminis]